MSKSSKGSQFERDICRLLSEWWSDGKRDDLFWRTSQSGGRATTRRKAGKDTFGQQGDITATHPKGRSLTKIVSMELKCGYSSAKLTDLFDKKKNEGSVWWDFFDQARTAAKHSKVPYWWLIVRQNRCEAMLYMPRAMALDLRSVCPDLQNIAPTFTFIVRRKGGNRQAIAAFRLHDFLMTVTPKNMIIGCSQ